MRIGLAITLAFWAGCQGDTDGKGTPPGGPEVSSAVLSRPAADLAPLLWRLDLEADRPVTAQVRWTDGDHTVEIAFDEPAEVHGRLLAGFRAGRTYEVTATVTDEDGGVTELDLGSIVAEAAPAYFPTAELVVDDPAARAPGHTLVALHTAMGNAPGTPEIAAVYDEQGHLCWWLEGDLLFQAMHDAGEGPLFALFGEGDDAIVGESSWTGELVRWWSPDPAVAPGVQLQASQALGTFHHDAVRTADGRILAIQRAAVDVPAYPTDYFDPTTAPATISDDLFVRFAPDGQVDAVARLSSLLPVTRIGFGSLDLNNAGLLDWAHANAIVEDAATGQVIVSLRHQDALIAFHWEAGGEARLDWILGNHENWPAEWQPFLLEPVGALEWPFHQHGPEIVASDDGAITIVLFDNGNFRAAPYGEPPAPTGQYSRVVQYTIDRAAGTVVEDWSYADTRVGPLFANAVGNADQQPNGTVLSTWGMLLSVNGVANTDVGLGNQAIRLIELDPATSTEVWHLALTTQASANPSGWSAYRSHRIPSLYGRELE